MERLVDLIYNNENGKFYTDHDLLDNKTDDEIFNLRRELQIDILENTPKYACAYYKTRLYLRGNPYKVHYFCHIRRNPDCPIEIYPKWPLEKLKAYIYNGARESPLHKTMKESLEEALLKDNRFSEIRVEKTISDGSSWRKPDLQAHFNDKKYVFEIQISNTFLSVIVARELFYRNMDIPLIWIFGEFKKRDIHFYEKDIFYHHNGNLFLFDDETYKKSIEANTLLLKVFYLVPHFSNGDIITLWCDKPETIDFSKIQFDKDKDGCIRAFYKNFDKHYEFMEIKGKFFDFIKSKKGMHINNDELKTYLKSFHKYGFSLYENWYDVGRISLLIITFLSIEDNTVYEYKFYNYKSLIHHVFHNYYNVYWVLYEYMKQKNI
jgi:competence CoiA-like predicted nuclease